MSRLHDRMPVLLPTDESAQAWLAGDESEVIMYIFSFFPQCLNSGPHFSNSESRTSLYFLLDDAKFQRELPEKMRFQILEYFRSIGITMIAI